MRTASIVALLTAMSLVVASAQGLHTPAAGSAERRAVGDAARGYVMSNYAERALPQPIVFKIERLVVASRFANTEAVPVFKDGTSAIPTYLPDFVLNFCLQKAGAGWQVVADL